MNENTATNYPITGNNLSATEQMSAIRNRKQNKDKTPE